VGKYYLTSLLKEGEQGGRGPHLDPSVSLDRDLKPFWDELKLKFMQSNET